MLTAQCSAVLKNVFLSPEGRPVLLDLDTCLGRPVWWGPAGRTCFAPGGALAYADETLQAVHLQLLREIEDGNTFGLPAGEARVLKSRAQLILREGLTQAAPAHTRLRPNFFFATA